MMTHNQMAARIKRFTDVARQLSFNVRVVDDPPIFKQVVLLHDVKRLICNFAECKDPEYIPPPSWVNRDCVGYLLQRGWKLTDEKSGLHRRGYFIPAEAIISSGAGGPESTADQLEIEESERTDLKYE